MSEVERADQERCLFCRRQYNVRSIPCWALDRRLRAVGTVHQGCRAKYCRREELPLEFAQVATEHSLDYARRLAWVWARWSGARTASVHARILFFEPADTREELLAHWRNGPLQFSPARLEEIQREGARLEQRYTQAVAAAERSSAGYENLTGL